MQQLVALLRGINLGPRRRVAMADLRAALEAAGHAGVRTHGQSGNVVLASAQAPDALAAALRTQIREALTLDTAVVVRTGAELAAVVADHPLREVATDPRRLQVTFLDEPPDPAAARELEGADLGEERIAVRGREIHVWHAHGIQRSPAAALLGRRLGAVGTARNWNTVTKLLALVGG